MLNTESRFNVYISRVLKNISSTNKLDKFTKLQINKILCILLRKISYLSLYFIKYAKRKIIKPWDIKRVINILFTGELRQNSIDEGERAINDYKNKVNNLIFPPNLIKKFLKNFGYHNVYIGKQTTVYTSSVIEYFTSQILEISCIQTLKNKRIKIIPEYLNIACKDDVEINNVITLLNINSLQKNKYKSLCFTGQMFKRIAKHIFDINKTPKSRKLKFSRDFFMTLQYYIENYMINLLKQSINITKNSNRIKLMPKDILLVKQIYDNS